MKIEELKQGQTVWVKGYVDSSGFGGCGGFIDFYNQDGNHCGHISRNNVREMKEEDVQIDQPKPVVAQLVADWYEEHKEYLEYDLYLYQMSIYDGKAKKDDFYYWMQKTNNPVHKLINMHQFGYTVEKEKLYTVEIPNPNRNSKGCAKFRLEKLGDKVYLVKRKSKDVYQNKDSQKLTEAEIRKDFEWAWQWAKEVMK